MAINLGCTMQELVDAVNDASAAPSNMVTTDTAQTIKAAKTFSKEVAFDNQIRANGGVGTAGQVLTSQGTNKAPVWKTPSSGSTPSNMVTTNTNQTITGSKTFTGTLITEGVAAKFTNAVIGGDSGIILDCYELQGGGDSIFCVTAKGEDKGEVWFGDGSVDVNIALGSYTYISSDVILGASSTSYPKNIIQKTGMTLLTSPAANTIASTTYGASGISRSLGNHGYTISLPSSNGTLALTSQIPIKTAKLSGTTLSITLG